MNIWRQPSGWKRSLVAGVGSAALLAVIPAMNACLSPDMPLSPELVDGEPDDSDCSAVTYENFGENFFQSYCVRCHSARLVGDFARSDAPVGINYDTVDGVREFATRIRLRAGLLGDMPPVLLPGPRPSESERRMLIRWIDCDTPTEADIQEGG